MFEDPRHTFDVKLVTWDDRLPKYDLYSTVRNEKTENDLSEVTLAVEDGCFCWQVSFGKSARFQVPKNGTSSAQIFERTPKTSRNTP